MTDKERLEEIKMKTNNTTEPMLYVPYSDINWLIKQAERVQELEETNKKNYWIAADFKFENLKLEQQNKRYQEVIKAIEKYANDCIDVGVEMNPHLVIDDIKALEESE